MFFFCFAGYVSCTYLGIDLGTSYIKAAVLRSGRSIEIVLNEQTKRKTPSMVSFEPDIPIISENVKKIDRRIGISAMNVMKRNSSLVIRALTEVIGKDWTQELQDSLNERFIDFNFSNSMTNGIEPHVVLSMLISQIANHAQNQIQSESVRDVVIAVPAFFTDAQRGKVAAAVKLAGLNLLKIIDEKTALALVYALERTSFFTKEPRNVAIIDFGASAISVSGYKFTAKIISQKGRNPKTVPKVEEISYNWDEGLGGIDFDICIARHLKQMHNLQRVDQTLIDDSEKIKLALTLTDVSNTSSDSIGKRILFSRNEFNSICSPQLDRLERLLKSVNQTFDSIELIGGASRIPSVQDVITKILGNTSRSLNSDESIVMGAAYTAAMSSGTFKAIEIVHDPGNAHSIDLIIGQKVINVIKQGSSLSKTKTVRFDPQNETKFKLEYSSCVPVGSTKVIGEWEIINTEYLNATESRVQLNLCFNKHTRVIIEKGIAYVKNPDTETKQIPLTIKRVLNPFKTPKEDSFKYKSLISSFNSNEIRLTKIAETRNFIESYLFQIMENLRRDSIWELVTTSDEKDLINNTVTSIHEWIDNSKDFESDIDLKARYEVVLNMAKPIEFRVNEYRTRGILIKQCETLFNEVEESIKKIWPMKGMKIPKSPKKITTEYMKNFKEWLLKKAQEQSSLQPWMDPVLLSSELESKYLKLSDMFSKLSDAVQAESRSPSKSSSTNTEL